MAKISTIEIIVQTDDDVDPITVMDFLQQQAVDFKHVYTEEHHADFDIIDADVTSERTAEEML